MSNQTSTITPQSTLSSYLNDHLAGSKAAIELVESIRAENEGTPLGELLGRLATEIETDRGTLEGLMTGLGVETSPVKQAAGWMLERLSRLRFDERVTRSAATTRLMQLETLSLGIEGKVMLWNALEQVGETSFEGADFAGLVTRAQTQRKDIEPFRLEAAAAGLEA
jgi:hypothetical protein